MTTIYKVKLKIKVQDKLFEKRIRIYPIAGKFKAKFTV